MDHWRGGPSDGRGRLVGETGISWGAMSGRFGEAVALEWE